MKALRLWSRMNAVIASKGEQKGCDWQKVLWRKWRKVCRRNGVSGV